MVNQTTQMKRTEAIRYVIKSFVIENLAEARGRLFEGEDSKYSEATSVLTPEEIRECAQRASELYQNGENFGRALGLDSWKNTKRSNQIGFAYIDRQIDGVLKIGLTMPAETYQGLLPTLYPIFGFRGTARILAERMFTRKKY